MAATSGLDQLVRLETRARWPDNFLTFAEFVALVLLKIMRCAGNYSLTLSFCMEDFSKHKL